ncbi:MAG: hypothetical protein ACRDZ5_03130 [Acidimicrobiales bacterium]
MVAPGCLAAGYWQFSLATHGEKIAWIYTVEWPFFCAYAIYMWWRLLHDDPVARKNAMAAPPVSPARAHLTRASGAANAVPVPTGGERTGHAPEGPDVAFDPYDEADPELAAYNRYLASLHERDRSGRH